MTEQLPPDADPLAAVPAPPPADDGLDVDAPEHTAESPAPPDDGDADAEVHPADAELPF